MKRGIIAKILGMAAVAGFSFVASAEVKENPYQIIIDRNAFGLRPIPPPPEPKKEEAPPAPPPDIKLTGITTLLGTPRVMLQVEDKQTKKYSFPTIVEGDSDSATGISVVSIDVENMRVRIRNGEAETTLDFKNNGVKPGAGAMVAAAPVPHPGLAPLGGVPPPGAVAGAAPVNSLAGRSAIVSGGAATAPVAPNALQNLGGGVPPRPLRTDSLSIMAGGGNQVYNPNPQAAFQQQPAMSQLDAEARIEAARRMIQEKQAAGQAVPHSPNILPPTTLGRAAGTIPSPPSP